MTDNAPEIRRMNLKSIRASIDFFKYLTVRGGRLIRNGNRYTLEVGGGGTAGRWSGVYMFNGLYGDKTGTLKEPGESLDPYTLDDIEGQYVGCLIDTREPDAGRVEFSDDPMSEFGTDQWEWRYIANKDEEGNYSWSNRTVGDIPFRVS